MSKVFRFEPLFLACALNGLALLAAWSGTSTSFSQLLDYWILGFGQLNGFAMQMVLMLVLGHVVVHSPLARRPLRRLLSGLLRLPDPALGLLVMSALLSWFHWGFGLVAGGLLASQLARYRPHARLRYAAAAYGGFIVWHGGWSGSAPLVVATTGHPWAETMGVIPVRETLLSPLNLTLLVAVVGAALLTLLFLPDSSASRAGSTEEQIDADAGAPESGAELLQVEDAEAPRDYVFWVGLLLLLMPLVGMALGRQGLNLNTVLLLLFGLAFCVQGQQERLQARVAEGLGQTVGILIQFPLYGAIMAVVKESGLATAAATYMIAHASPAGFLPLTFLGAGALNLVVPSGGGQWAVQAPVLIPAAQALQVPLAKMVVAFSWGDAWTNLIQPFWALPLLAMTGVSARKLLPYTAALCVTTGLMAVAVLWGLT